MRSGLALGGGGVRAAGGEALWVALGRGVGEMACGCWCGEVFVCGGVCGAVCVWVCVCVCVRVCVCA